MSGATMDFPSAWEFVRSTKPEDHHERCSWRTEAGALLCDCSVLWIEYGRREERQAADRVRLEAGEKANSGPVRDRLAAALPPPLPSSEDIETYRLDTTDWMTENWREFDAHRRLETADAILAADPSLFVANDDPCPECGNTRFDGHEDYCKRANSGDYVLVPREALLAIKWSELPDGPCWCQHYDDGRGDKPLRHVARCHRIRGALNTAGEKP